MKQAIQVADPTPPMRGEVMLEIRDAKTGKLKAREVYKNLVVSVAKTEIAKALCGVVGENQGQVTYCAVGTGTNAPASGDTQLQTELHRKLISVRTPTNNQAVFKTFYNQNEANGVLREAGLFGYNATAAANTGALFARVAINRTKSANDTLTLTWTIVVG